MMIFVFFRCMILPIFVAGEKSRSLMPTVGEGVKVLCNLSFEDTKGPFAGMEFGECKSVPDQMKDNKLLIEILESSAEERIRSTSILPNTSYAVFPSNPDHMVVPSVSLLHDVPHHSTSHYLPLKPEHEMTFCTPLQCLSIPFTSYFTLQPLDFTSSTSCPPNRYLLIDYQKGSPHPKGVCIHDTEGDNFDEWHKALKEYRNPKNSHTKLVEEKKALDEKRNQKRIKREKETGVEEMPFIMEYALSPPTSHFYYLTPSLTLDNFVDRTIKGTRIVSQTTPLTPLSYESPSLSFHVYRPPSTLDNAKGVSITHLFFPIPSLSSPLYTLRTPRHVYSLSKDKSGKLQLESHMGEEGDEQVAEKIRQDRQDRLTKTKAELFEKYKGQPGYGTTPTGRSWYERGSGCLKDSDWKISGPLHSLVYEVYYNDDFPFVGELGEPALYSNPSFSSPPPGVTDERNRFGRVSLEFYLKTYREWNAAGRPGENGVLEEPEAEGAEGVEGTEGTEGAGAEEDKEIETWIDPRRQSWEIYFTNQGIDLQALAIEAQKAQKNKKKSTVTESKMTGQGLIQPKGKGPQGANPVKTDMQTSTLPPTDADFFEPSPTKQPEGVPWETIAYVALILVLIVGLIGVVIRNKRRRSKRSSLDSSEAALVNQEDPLASP